MLPFNDGSSSIYGIFKNGDLLATVEQPWAVDASGEDIRTDLKIEGNSLVQTVDHNSSFEYPFTADPEVDWGGSRLQFVFHGMKPALLGR